MLGFRSVQLLCLFLIVLDMTCARAAIDAYPGNKQGSESVVLRWKIPQSGYLAYDTNMEKVEPENGHLFQFNLKEYIHDKDAQESMPDNLSIDMPDTYSVTTLMQAKNDGGIKIKLYMNPTKSGETEEDEEEPQNVEEDMNRAVRKMMKQMEGTVIIRGEIDDTGAIRSYYIQQSQKNLLSLFFELPKEPVKVGDTWPLDVSLIEMGNGFVCDHEERQNAVSLVSLINTDQGETIAVLKYLIYEAVEGRMIMPKMPDDMPGEGLGDVLGVSYSYGLIGEAQFLVNEGRWKQFNGIMDIQSKGIISSSVKQHFALKYRDSVKQELLDME